MRARTEYAYSSEVYGTLQRMLAKLLEAMPEKVRVLKRVLPPLTAVLLVATSNQRVNTFRTAHYHRTMLPNAAFAT